MDIEVIPNGYLEENCYVLTKGNKCIVIDPGTKEVIDYLKNKNICAVLITHYHFDHIGALDDILKDKNIKLVDYKSNNNQDINDFKFKIIDTKGHTDDSVTYYFYEDNVMFTGDFLFKESIGRFDFENSDIMDMRNSIKEIKKYDKSIVIYPGHGLSSTLDYEFKNNIYLKGDFYE